jgi:protein-tyrosine kinase
MERIKLAIDKARQLAQQHSLGAESGPPVRATPARGFPHSPPALVPVRKQILDPKHLAANRIVAFQRIGPSRLPFDLLRTQVLQKMQANGWKTLAVTSPSVHSGKTMVAINLAMTAAHHPDHNVVLVDFDLRRPSIANYLGLSSGTSLSDVLAGKAELAEAMVDVGLAKLLVLPTEHPVPGSAEVLGSARATNLIDRLKASSDNGITIFDLPPVAAVDDVIAVLPRIDCVLLVVGNGTSTKREIEESQRHLAHANVIGYVLNKATVTTRTGDYY